MLVKGADLLRRDMKPYKYVDLCRKVLTLTECEPYADDSNVEEMFRNRLAYDSKQRFAVADGYVAMTEWLRKEDQLCLPFRPLGTSVEPFVFDQLPGCWKRGVDKADEIARRSGFKENYNRKLLGRHIRAQLGMAVEQCVCEWFKSAFSEHYRAGSLYGWDFCLEVNGRSFPIDVKSTTPGKPGEAVIPRNNLKDGYNYLFAEPYKDDAVAMRGWLPRHKILEKWQTEFGYVVPYVKINAIQVLIFRIHCALESIDYHIFKEALNRER